jgi:hypothetical protein
MTLALQLFKNTSINTQEKLRLNLHSLSVSDLLEYGGKPSLDLGLYSAGNYRTGHLPRRGLVDFTSSQIYSPITLWSEIDQKPTTKAIYTVQ